jgi:hypothetical protein
VLTRADRLGLFEAITPRRKGTRVWRGFCPFHHGLDPDEFEFDTVSLHWRCHSKFNCGAGGLLAYMNGGRFPHGTALQEVVVRLLATFGDSPDLIAPAISIVEERDLFDRERLASLMEVIVSEGRLLLAQRALAKDYVRQLDIGLLPDVATMPLLQDLAGGFPEGAELLERARSLGAPTTFFTARRDVFGRLCSLNSSRGAVTLRKHIDAGCAPAIVWPLVGTGTGKEPHRSESVLRERIGGRYLFLDRDSDSVGLSVAGCPAAIAIGHLDTVELRALIRAIGAPSEYSVFYFVHMHGHVPETDVPEDRCPACFKYPESFLKLLEAAEHEGMREKVRIVIPRQAHYAGKVIGDSVKVVLRDASARHPSHTHVDSVAAGPRSNANPEWSPAVDWPEDVENASEFESWVTDRALSPAELLVAGCLGGYSESDEYADVVSATDQVVEVARVLAARSLSGVLRDFCQLAAGRLGYSPAALSEFSKERLS